MAQEFAGYLNASRKGPIRDRVTTLSEIVENIMQIILKIPDMVDGTINQIRNQISQMNAQITGLQGRIQAVEGRGGNGAQLPQQGELKVPVPYQNHLPPSACP